MTIIMTVIITMIIITMIIITMIRVERGGEPVLGASVRADITGPGGKLQHLRLEVKTPHSQNSIVIDTFLLICGYLHQISKPDTIDKYQPGYDQDSGSGYPDITSGDGAYTAYLPNVASRCRQHPSP